MEIMKDLDTMQTQSAEVRITQSRVRLLMNKPFFGTLATRLRIVEFDMPTAATDGRHFYFNREFVDSLTDAELDFLVAHEVLHCVYDHLGAREDRFPILYNVACDYNINYTLVDLAIGEIIGEDKLNGGKPCYDRKYKDMNSYEIYDQLLKEGADQQNMQGMDVHLDLGEGAGTDEETKGKVKPMTAQERKELQDEIKQAVIQAAAGAGNDVPSDVKRMIRDLTEPKLSWKDVLRVQMESSLKSDFTFMRPSKRSGEVIFPGMNKDEELHALLALDMSGSISNDTAKEMLSETHGIMQQYDSYKITVLCFDTGIYSVETFTSEDGKDIRDYEPVGGGGTEFDIVWKYMEKEGIEPDQLIMFTDGYPWGSWGNPDYCDTLFVVHGNPQKTIVAPFGTTIHYE